MVWFSNGQALAMAIVPTIRKMDHLKSGNFCPDFLHFWQNGGHLSKFKMVRSHSNSGPLTNQSLFDHSKFRWISDPQCIEKKYHLLKRPILILFVAFGSFLRPCPLTWCPSPTTPSTSGAWSTTSSTTQSRSNLWESWDPSRTSGWKKTRSWAAPILICIRVRFQQKKISLRFFFYVLNKKISLRCCRCRIEQNSLSYPPSPHGQNLSSKIFQSSHQSSSRKGSTGSKLELRVSIFCEDNDVIFPAVVAWFVKASFFHSVKCERFGSKIH